MQARAILAAASLHVLFLLLGVTLSDVALARGPQQLTAPPPTAPPAAQSPDPGQSGMARHLSDLMPGSAARSRADAIRHDGFRDGTAELRRRQVESGKHLKHGATLDTVPYWSGSYTYQGLEFTYRMVGSDPKNGSTTTVVPTVIIPLRFVFPDGQVFDASTDLVDGQTPVQGIVNSPIFQNYHFVLGGTAVGDTQYGDAFQRANFWNSVSTRAPNYHVLLGQPTVLPAQIIQVPQGRGTYFTNPSTGRTIPLVDFGLLAEQETAIRASLNLSPRSLAMMVWGQVVVQSVSFPGLPAVRGWHGSEPVSGGQLTFVSASYDSAQGSYWPDIYTMSHEIVEWLDDPFGDNFTAGWNPPYIARGDRCDSTYVAGDAMEVADPVEMFVESAVALPTSTFTYHVTEAMFIDFFTRRDRSRSVNGQYSMFTFGAPYGLPSEPSAPCTGHVEYEASYVEYPGAYFTDVNGINSQGWIVGGYWDLAGGHAFVRDDSGFRTLDPPGAQWARAFKINNSGAIVGNYIDAFGFMHGFSYHNGRWRQIDVPGAADTIAFGINDQGDIVGSYDNNEPITRAFVLRGDRYERLDSPLGTQTMAFGINDLGVVAGVAYDDPYGPVLGFTFWNGNFREFGFPGAFNTQPTSVSNMNDLAGLFVDYFGLTGMVTVAGYPHVVGAITWGNDSNGHIVGYAYDFGAGRWKGVIGTLPLARNVH